MGTRSTTIPMCISTGALRSRGARRDWTLRIFCWAWIRATRRGTRSISTTRNLLAGAYAQDSWQVRPGLTLNYGVRWDMLPPWYEKYNQLQTLVPGEQSVVFPECAGGNCVSGRSGRAADTGCDAVCGFWAARGRGVVSFVARRSGEDELARFVGAVLHAGGGIVAGDHERESAVWIHVHERGADAVRHAVDGGGGRVEPECEWAAEISAGEDAVWGFADASGGKRELGGV